LRRRAASILLALLVTAGSGCTTLAPDLAALPPRPGEASPLLWRATSPAGGTFYMLGSVHVGRGRAPKLGPVVDAAWNRAEELVVEVDVSRVSEAELSALMERWGQLESGRKIWSLLGPDTSKQLRAYLESRAVDPVLLASMKPWFLAMVVMQLELQRYGYEVEYGVDNLFTDRAAGRMKIVSLETMDSQLQALDRLPASFQERMLNDELSRIDRLEQDTEDLLAAWRLGDEMALERLVFRPLEASADIEVFYELIFFRRNELMAIGLENLGRDGRSRFVVIGAGHLLGDRSVRAQLAKRGYRIERIRSLSQLMDSR
jgi:uncharacterized protein YbaP (TraB family)